MWFDGKGKEVLAAGTNYDEERSEASGESIRRYRQVSQSTMASRLNCSQSYVSKTLKDKTNIKCYKKTKPSVYRRTNPEVKTQCRRLNRKSLGKDFIIDDEHFFPLSKPQVPGITDSTPATKKNAPPELKHYFKQVWEEGDVLDRTFTTGHFETFLRAVQQRCEPARVPGELFEEDSGPFIRDNYSEGDYLFWPDKASSHYAKTVVDFLRGEHIAFVEKEDNPTNLPQARPIEDFFGYLDQLVYHKGWTAKNTDQLIRRVKIFP